MIDFNIVLAGFADAFTLYNMLFVLFGAPLLAAWQLVGSWRPAGSVAHGELIDPPRSLDALVRVRSRVHRGNRQLDQLVARREQELAAPKWDLLRRIAARPSLWPSFACFLGVGFLARTRSRFTGPVWERDLGSRQNPQPEV